LAKKKKKGPWEREGPGKPFSGTWRASGKRGAWGGGEGGWALSTRRRLGCRPWRTGEKKFVTSKTITPRKGI